MKRLLLLLMLLGVARFGHATAYTASCTPLMMHVGDEVPPGIWTVVNNTAPTVNLGGGAAIFATPPSLCTPSATNTSPVGTYTSTMNPGTLANPGTDTITYTNGNIQVIAPTSIGSGAVLNDTLTYPSWFTGAGAYSALDVTNNGICNLVGDGVFDNKACLIELFAMLRGGNEAKVTCNGTNAVAQTAGTFFTGLDPALPIYINGTLYHTGTVTDSQHMTVNDIHDNATTCPSGTNLIAALPPSIVSTTAGSTTVTWVSGSQWLGAGYVVASTQKVMLNGGVFFGIGAAPTTGTSLTLATAPTFTSAATPMYNGFYFNGSANAGSTPFFLYFPPGVYATSDQFTPFGAYWSMWGAGPYKSIIKLLPNSNVQGGATTSFFNQNAVNVNNTYNVNVTGIGFEIGPGNPNVYPIEWVPSNYAVLSDVAGWADDSNVPAITNFSRNGMGPGLLKNFAAYGGKEGFLLGNPVFSITGENITIQGQTLTAGILGNQLANFWRHVFVYEPSGVPAGTNTAAGALAFWMDSEVYANNGALAFKNSTASGFPASSFSIKNVTINGYTNSVQDCASGTCVFDQPGNITMRQTGPVQSLFNTSPALLNLPVKETPKANDPPVAQICQLGDNLAAWQGVFNSCNSGTVESPPGQYGLNVKVTGSIPITVPDSINHINCNFAAPPPGATYNIVFTVAGTSSTPLILEGCPEGQNSVVHSGSRTLVLLNDKTSSYLANQGSGDLFCENCIIGGNTGGDSTVTFYSSQHFYCRQCNPEQPTADKYTLNGATAWVFGAKSEHGGAFFNMSNGARAEVYGLMALGNPGNGNPNGTLFKVTDSDLDFIAAAVTQCTITQGSGACNNQFTNWATITRNGVSQTMPVPNATVVGNTQVMGLFIDAGLSGVSPPQVTIPLFQIGNFLRKGRFF